MIRLHLLGALELAATDGHDLRPLVAQPKRLAVLAYLATRPAGEFVRRDTLLGVFWPDLDQAAARRSLRQALHVLRTHLGGDALTTRGDDDVAASPASLACDVPGFLAALAEGRLEDALERYRGDLLRGFFLSGGSAGFEQWLEGERERLRALAARAAWRLAEAAEQAGNNGKAAEWARRGVALTPDDEVALRRLIELLVRVGDRAGALHAYDGFARRLAREFDEQPARETRALIESLGGPVEVPIAVAPPPPRAAVAAPPRGWRPPWIVAAAAAAVAVALTGTLLLGRHAPTAPVLAVGEIRGGDSTVPGVAIQTLPELLATDLAQVGGLRVISHPRLEEIAAQLGVAARGSLTVARAAGASALLEGVLYRRSGDSLQLDLRQVDARSGELRAAFSLRSRDLFALADSAAAHFANRVGGATTAPPRAIAQVTSASLAAHALYDEGLRTYYRNADYRAAARLFRAALDQDSTFAMAALYVGRSLSALDDPARGSAYALAARLASHATEREALLIRFLWRLTENDPAWTAIAESLAARDPDEPESHYALGLARVYSADYVGALAPLREAIRMDSLGLTGAWARCVACDAYETLVQTYIVSDSLPAAERTAREDLRRRPRAPNAWLELEAVLDREGRLAEALAADRAAAQLQGTAGDDVFARAYYALRAGDFAVADTLLVEMTRSRDARHVSEATFWQVISELQQGRPHRAVVAARRLLALEPARSNPLAPLPLGMALRETGDLAAAARTFGGAGIVPHGTAGWSPSGAARPRVWALTQWAGVVAEQGDTALLRQLGDSLVLYGRQSGFGRDRRLPSYVHGLSARLAGHPAAAADSFVAAVTSPTSGFSRLNVELAGTLLDLGRPGEAIRWVQAALRGALDAGNLYATRTGEHELLARAFASAGEVDSARAHYAWVVHAWAHAEPQFQPRRDAALRYLASTGGVTGLP
jgi:DNA-binding SARP family transcriptional activator